MKHRLKSGETFTDFLCRAGTVREQYEARAAPRRCPSFLQISLDHRFTENFKLKLPGSTLALSAGCIHHMTRSFLGQSMPGKTPEIITSHDVSKPLKQALWASRDVITASHSCGSSRRKQNLTHECARPTSAHTRDSPRKLPRNVLQRRPWKRPRKCPLKWLRLSCPVFT